MSNNTIKIIINIGGPRASARQDRDPRDNSQRLQAAKHNQKYPYPTQHQSTGSTPKADPGLPQQVKKVKTRKSLNYK